MKRTLFCIALATAVVGCNGDADGEAGAGGTQYVTVASGTNGKGAFYQIGGAVAQTLEANAGELDWTVTNTETPGTQANIRLLESGDAQLAVVNGAIAYFAPKGEEEFQKQYAIRNVMSLGANYAAFVARADSGLKSVADLKGKKVVVGPKAAGFEMFLKPILAAHGIAYDDFEAIDGDYGRAKEMIGDNQADAAFIGGAIPVPALQGLSQEMPLTFLKFEPAALDQLAETYEFYEKGVIPAGSYKGVDEDFPTIKCGFIQVVSHEKVPADLVYRVTKILYEHRDQAAKVHPAFKAAKPGQVVRTFGLEMHPGAERYYREAGLLGDGGDVPAGAAD